VGGSRGSRQLSNALQRTEGNRRSPGVRREHAISGVSLRERLEAHQGGTCWAMKGKAGRGGHGKKIFEH